MNNPNSTRFLMIMLELLPFLAGLIIFALNKDSVNQFTENIESWLRMKKSSFASKTGSFSRYAVKPLLWLMVKFFDWTDRLGNRGLKNGIRVTASLYVFFLWLYLLFTAFIVIAAIIISLFLLGIVFKFLGGGDDEPSSKNRTNVFSVRNNRQSNRDITAFAGVKGKKVYEGTSWFNEVLKGRVSEDGIIFKGTSFINEERIGRIGDNGSIYKGTNSFNEIKIGRIDDDGTIIKGSNWFNEEKAGRIDEHGTVFKGKHWLDEKRTGRTTD